ncbi:MAG: hypothetical protein WC698_00280 [Candidatus Peribacteraceae bacterium]
MPLLLRHPLFSLSFLLKRSYIAPQKYFSRGELTAAQLTAFHEVIDVLAGYLEVPHHIAHAHEFGEVLHIVRA